MTSPRSFGLSDAGGIGRPPDNGAVVAALLAEEGLDPVHAARRATGLFRLASLPPVVAAEVSGSESVRVLCCDGAHYLVTPWNAYLETSCGGTVRLTSRSLASHAADAIDGTAPYEIISAADALAPAVIL